MWACAIQGMWNMSVSACPMWKFVCMKGGAAPRLVAGTHVILVSHKDPGEAGSSSKWVCCCCGEMSWEDLDSADERSGECGGTGTQHGSERRRSGPQEVAPAYAIICVCHVGVNSQGEFRVNSQILLLVPTPDWAPYMCGARAAHRKERKIGKIGTEDRNKWSRKSC